ncbi:MAG: LCP family protein [Acidimicrobiales bacterium]
MPRQRLRWTRTPAQRLVLAINTVLITVLALGAVTLGYAAQKLGAVDRLDVSSELTAATETTMVSAGSLTILTPEAMSGASTTTQAPRPAGPPENYLIVGSDNAEDLDPDDPALIGRDDALGNHLADTIMVLRLEPATGAAYLLSIPRDLEVDIWDTQRRLKINSAFNFNEPYEDQVKRLINTVEDNFDIALQHYVEVDLAAFQRLVDAVGGVEVCFAGPTTNPRTGLDIKSGGWQLLDGRTALFWVRSRNELVQQRLDGTWVSMSPRADLDRIERQQDFVRQMVDQAVSDVVSDPGLLLEVLDIAADELAVSNSFSIVGDGRDLATWFRDLEDEDLVTMTLDVFDLPVDASRNNEYRLGLVDNDNNQRILDIFRGIPVDAVVPKRVEVSIRADGQDQVASDLAGLGFEIGTQWAAADGVEGVAIRYGIGGTDAANLVAAYLDFAVDFVADTSLAADQVVLEWSGPAPEVLAVPRPLTAVAQPIPTTTTTADDSQAATTTTPAVSEFEFDCDAPRP